MAASDRQAIDQILRRRRSDSDEYWGLALQRYRDLSAWAPEALALAPVGLAAAVESFVRDTIRDLVDSGEPFVERIGKLKLRTQPGIEAMKALHGRRISLGEWVSHLVRIGSVPHLDDHLSTLFVAPNLPSLLAEVRYFHGPSPSDFGVTWDDENENAPTNDLGEPEEEPRVVGDPTRVISSLGRLFEARHRAAHEATPPALDLPTLTAWRDDAQLFCDALHHLTEATLRPLEPYGTVMMELKAATDLGRATTELDERLEQLYAKIEALPEHDDHRDRHWSGLPFITPVEFSALARRAQVAWLSYRDAELEFQAYYWPDGTGWKTWQMSAELDLVEERSHRVAQSLQNADVFFDDDDPA